ncbi:MAG: hypothetical protein ACRDY1_15280, partial [Acidimicrobiales bacterium]
GLATGGVTQVSCNLVDPLAVGPVDIFDEVGRRAARAGVAVGRGELVGLVPAAVVQSTPEPRRAEIGLDVGRTVEACLVRGRPG